MKIEDEIKQKVFPDEYKKAVINITFTAIWQMSWQNKLLKPFGISIQQFNILRILRGQHPSPAPLKLLTERMIDKMSNTSRLVEKLKIKGYVKRDVCPNNRRQVDITITDEGLKLINHVSSILDKTTDEKKLISEEEAREINRILDKLRG